MLYDNQYCLYHQQNPITTSSRVFCSKKLGQFNLTLCDAIEGFCPAYVPSVLPVYRVSAVNKSTKEKICDSYYCFLSHARTQFNTLSKIYHTPFTITKTRLAYQDAKYKCHDMEEYILQNKNNLFISNIYDIRRYKMENIIQDFLENVLNYGEDEVDTPMGTIGADMSEIENRGKIESEFTLHLTEESQKFYSYDAFERATKRAFEEAYNG